MLTYTHHGHATSPKARTTVHRAITTAVQHIEQARNLVLTSDESVGPRRFRVAIRRLRTAVRAVRPVLPRLTCDRFDEAARRLSQVVGRWRDADVVAHDILAKARPEWSAHDAWEPLNAIVEHHQSAMRTLARAALTGGAWSAFQRHLGQLQRDIDTVRALDGPTRKLARKALDRAWRRVIERGKHFEDLDRTARHDLRLAVKRQRYMLDLFAGCFDPKAVNQQRKRMRVLQAELGRLNDVAEAGRLARLAIAANAGPSVRTLVAQLLARYENVASNEDQAARAAWLDLRAIEPIWQDG